jgi:hypothetical protein
MIFKKMFDYTDALKSLRPNSNWTFSGNEYSGLTWLDIDSPPSEEALIEETQRLQTEWDLLEYQRLRANEYPDFTKYLDGIVKGDQEQINEYIRECMEIKNKYPKPE